MENLHDIDRSLGATVIALKKIIQHYTFSVQFEFQLNTSIDYEKFKKLHYPGPYLFEIKNADQLRFNEWIVRFKELWEHPNFVKNFVPNTKFKRVRSHAPVQIYDWIPLYIG